MSEPQTIGIDLSSEPDRTGWAVSWIAEGGRRRFEFFDTEQEAEQFMMDMCRRPSSEGTEA